MASEEIKPVEKDLRIAQALTRFDATHLNLELRNWNEAKVLFGISFGLTLIYVPSLKYFAAHHNIQAVTICIFAGSIACALAFCGACRAARSFATICHDATDIALFAAIGSWATGYLFTLVIVVCMRSYLLGRSPFE